MSSAITCECGRQLPVCDDSTRAVVRCPDCRRRLLVVDSAVYKAARLPAVRHSSFDPTSLRCPRGGHPMYWLGGRFGPGALDGPEAFHHYCIGCESAFLTVDEPADGARPPHFEWVRHGRRLVLQPTPPDQTTCLAEDEWELHQTNLSFACRQLVEGALNRTFDRGRLCPDCGSLAPLIGELPYDGEAAVRFSWCSGCRRGFALVQEPILGRRPVTDFVFDRTAREYRLGQVRNSEAHLPRLEECLRELAAGLGWAFAARA